MTTLKDKVNKLPFAPGVYFFRDLRGKIIYIGKASQLRRRVSSYFQKHHRDYKTNALVVEIADLETIEVGSELEALFLEAELIKRHKPRYNIAGRDDKNWIYVKITTQNDWPVVSYVRRPLDDGARYFGPFVQGYSVKQAMRYLRRIFPYLTEDEWGKASALPAQIGIAPDTRAGADEYRRNLRKLIAVIEGKQEQIIKRLERDMTRLSKRKQFEQAATVRNQFLGLKALSNKMLFGAEETFDLTMDQALNTLTDRLGIDGVPRRIEAYDISNFAGGDAVSSMIVFTDGLANNSEYRRFKMRTKGPNDFAMMAETMRRRFSGRHDDWSKPDLILIDGGKGQLGAALAVLDELGVNIPAIGLAKRLEEIIQRDGAGWKVIRLEPDSAMLQLLQRVRDEAHRFAVSYHTLTRDKRTKTSQLDSIVGIGPATRKKLIRQFGSVRGVKEASEVELAEVIGRKAKLVKEVLG